MSIVKDYMDTKTYMIITNKGYFLSHDTLKKEIDESIEYFKSRHNFGTIIDIIEDPYAELHLEKEELDTLYEKGIVSEKEYDKKFDKVFDKILDIEKNCISSVIMDSQMD